MEQTSSTDTHISVYEEFTKLCKMADEGGFHTIWTGEHHGMNFSITPNPLMLIADLANKTKNARLGTATLIAPFWHPIKLAGELAMADIITNGRLDVGISKGAYSYEYDRLTPGLTPFTSGEMMRELIPALKNLWNGNYAHNGKYWHFPSTTCAPIPVQQPHPPIWIACQHQNTFDFAVSNGCHIQVAPLWKGDDEVENLLNKFKTAVNTHPKQTKPKLLLLRHTYVAKTEAELRKVPETFSKYYCEFSSWFKNERPVYSGNIKPLSKADVADMTLFSGDYLLQNLVIGTPSQVIKRIKKYESLGYDEFALWLANGMPFNEKKKCLKLFIDKVMPAFL